MYMVGCPDCDCTKEANNVMVIKIYPRIHVCAECYTKYQVVEDGKGGYCVKNLGKYKGPFIS